jgi:CheY-like chemotaxis protein
MADDHTYYRLTAAGREAWESQDAAVPADYRRILWLMDFHGHAGVTRDLARHYPMEMLQQWLAEIEELGLIERVSEKEAGAAVRGADKTLVVNQEHFRRHAQSAGEELARTGAYLAAGRLAGRARLAKPRAETVILVVEDDPDQQALADLRVTMAGYKVRVAGSVKSFLQTMLEDGTPDLLLLDVALPDGDGFEVLERLRRHATLRELPVVMLTARNEPADIGRGLVAGADGYVINPYTKQIHADTIGAVLKQK